MPQFRHFAASKLRDHVGVLHDIVLSKEQLIYYDTTLKHSVGKSTLLYS